MAHSREDLIGQRDAIAHWARLSYGWMGRSPDYKASLMNALGANAAFYEKFADNAQELVRARAEPRAVHEPRHRQPAGRPHEGGRPGQGRVHQHPEGDRRRHRGVGRQGGGDVGRRITHYNFMGQNAAIPINDTDLAVMFIAPLNAPGSR